MTLIRFELSEALRERLGDSSVVTVNGAPARVLDGRFLEVDLPDDVIRGAIEESLLSELFIDVDGIPVTLTGADGADISGPVPGDD